MDKSKILAYQSHLFKDRTFSEEGLSVSVINSTEVPNLALKVSQVLRISGVRVISEESAPPSQERCQIKGEKNLEDSYTTQKIMNWFGCSFFGVNNLTRSDLEVVLGEGYSRYLSGSN